MGVVEEDVQREHAGIGGGTRQVSETDAGTAESGGSV